ncbi:PIN domain-containing protein [uncultured Thiohalocapsa sp.]|uniref:type II toxin-antitoxin system VapC family toxin n=1 Tax=uncultured Thiohalocapsa sp. TaxID=768990 RepID=UPI0025FDFBB9|nr:PIN domain-containing protein [uncultured Thiohalocapsa sp.]
MIFIDASALYAILDREDRVQAQARETWRSLLSAARPTALLTTNYILVESFALIQARLGLTAVRALNDAMLPVVSTCWVTEQDHTAAVSALLTQGRRRLSLVDCTSFAVMRRLNLRRAFAFDGHFAEQGFDLLPGGAEGG